ncbi:MAG: hypothetical protein ACOYMS_09045 [Terrimicrobiaceae bacterium]
MNDRQENKLSMYLAVLNVLQANTATWQPKVAFTAAQGAFVTAVGALQGLAQAQDTESAGATAQKQTTRLALADAALPISGALQGYAAVIGNGELAANATVTRTDLIHKRDSAALTIGQNLLALAQANAANLVAYDVSAAAIAAFGQIVTDYAALLQRPRAVIASRAAATGQLAAAFSTVDGILKKRLDPLSLGFRASAPAFFLAYEAAREIVDNSGPGAAEPPVPPNP